MGVSQYIVKQITQFSEDMGKEVQTLLKLKRETNRLATKIANDERKMKEIVNKLKREQSQLSEKNKALAADDGLEPIFSATHSKKHRETWLNKELGTMWELIFGYYYYKEFKYVGQEPVYKIEATYGPKGNFSGDYIRGF